MGPPALDAGGGSDVGGCRQGPRWRCVTVIEGVDGGRGERRWTRVGDGCARVVDEVDAVDIEQRRRRALDVLNASSCACNPMTSLRVAESVVKNGKQGRSSAEVHAAS